MNIDLQAALINSISCGDEILNEKLQEQIHPIILISDSISCNKGLKYLHVKKDLLNYAISYSSGLIDLGHKESQETGDAKTTTTQEGKSSSQRTSNAIGCSWADSTGFRNYRRDAYSTDNSYSNTGKDGTSVSNRNGYDKSTSWTNGMNHFYNFYRGTIEGKGDGKSRTTTNGNHVGTGGTAEPSTFTSPEPVIPTLFADADFTPGTSNFDLPDFPIGTLVSKVVSAINDANNILSAPLVNNDSVGAASSVITPSCPIPQLAAGTNTNFTTYSPPPSTMPSFSISGGDTRTISVSIPIPTISFQLSTTFGGNSMRSQEQLSSYNATYNKDTIKSNIFYSQTDDGAGGTYALTKQFSGFNKNRHQHTDFDKRSKSYTDAESNGIAESSFESHYKSDRAAHSQKETNGQSTAQAKSITKVRGSSESEKISSDETIYWSQIFDSLQLMWEDTMREIQNARAKINASYKPASGKIPKTIICSPAQTRYFNESMFYLHR